MQIKIIDPRIGSDFPLPEYSTAGSAGIDLVACVDGPTKLGSGEVRLIGSGIAVQIEDPNLMGMVVPRSGLGHKHGIVTGNLVGIIDSDYQGEILISCWNRSDSDFTIHPGDRIAQMLFMPIHRVQWQVVEQFDHSSARGANGFGHTGISGTATAGKQP